MVFDWIAALFQRNSSSACTMAFKGQLGTYAALIASVLLSLGCGAGFMLLQHQCMNKSDKALVIGE